MEIKLYSSVNCGPCRKFAPVFSALETDNPEISFEKVSADEFENRTQLAEAGVKAVPTTVLYDDTGNEMLRFVGFKPKEDFQKIKDNNN